MENKKILIVEDEEPLRNALRDKLKSEGFQTLEAQNGEEGLQIALTQHPDLILLDVIMPVMDGITMLKKMRADEWGQTAQVVVLTNLNDNEKIAESMDAGSYGYLIKSDWKIADIVALVREKLK